MMKKVSFWIFLGFAALFIISWMRFNILQLTMIIGNYDAEYKKQTNRYMQLKLTQEHLTSYARLKNYGRDTLNMRFPDGDDYASGNDD
ncbi:MAG: cell division protein FtsL [candidate division WOR-3 bacterium]|nr:cell division protein FtsL [candidate division WOR-3 bacterium]